MRRFLAISAATAFAVTAFAAPAAAFIPPGQSDQHSCDPGAVEGHPGYKGQRIAVSQNGTNGAWNAHDRNPTGKILLCVV